MPKLRPFLVYSAVLTFFGCSSKQPLRVPDAAAQQHIREVISSLDPHSSIRRTLEGDQYASGVHETWMDDMRAVGLREVVFEVYGVWRTGSGFRPKRVERVIYRTKYDSPKSQLIDTDRIAKVRTSGLEAKLQDVAWKRATSSRWPFEPRFSLLGDNCFVDVYLFDDEWIGDRWRFTNTPIITPGDPVEVPLYSVAHVGDLHGLSQLLNTRTFDRKDLDNALIGAIDLPSDNTDVIRLLLSAGADVNTSLDDGTTILMESVSSLNIVNIELLVSSGADRSRKNRAGDTAISILNKQITRAEKSGGALPDFVDEIVKLLNSDPL